LHETADLVPIKFHSVGTVYSFIRVASSLKRRLGDQVKHVCAGESLKGTADDPGQPPVNYTVCTSAFSL